MSEVLSERVLLTGIAISRTDDSAVGVAKPSPNEARMDDTAVLWPGCKY